MARIYGALDIGTWGVRYAGLRTGGPKPVLENYHEIRFEEGILSGVFAQPKVKIHEIEARLREIAAVVRIPIEGVPVVLPDQFFSMKIVDVPGSSSGGDAGRDYTRWRLKQHLPAALIADCLIECHTIGPVETDQGAVIRVLAVLVKEKFLNSVAEAVISAGVSPTYFDLNSLGVHNLLSHGMASLVVDQPPTGSATVSAAQQVGSPAPAVQQKNESDHCVIHAGHWGCNVLFFGGSKLLFSRLFDRAGVHFTRNTAAFLGIEAFAAEELKKTRQFLPSSSAGIRTAEFDFLGFQEVFGEFLKEIDMTFRSFRSRFPGFEPDRVILSGGSALVPNMNRFLSSLTGSKVDVIDPSSIVHAGGSPPPMDLLVRLAPAIGAALREVIE